MAARSVEGVMVLVMVVTLSITSSSPLLPMDGMAAFGGGENFLFDPIGHLHHEEPHYGHHDYHHYEEWHPFEYSYGVHDPHNHLVGRESGVRCVTSLSLCRTTASTGRATSMAT